MNLEHELVRAINRRYFFGRCGAGLGLGAIALASLLGKEAHRRLIRAAGEPRHRAGQRDGGPQGLHTRSGQTRHLPAHGRLAQSARPVRRQAGPGKYSGKPCPAELLKGKRFAFITGVPNMLGSPFSFARHGQAGIELSNLWTHLPPRDRRLRRGQIGADRSVQPRPRHSFTCTPEQPQFGGARWVPGPLMGWAPRTRICPASSSSPVAARLRTPARASGARGSLPSVHQGVQCRSPGDPVLFLSDPDGMNRTGRRDTLDTLNQLNAWQAEAVGDPETLTRIAQYELAFRMQLARPKSWTSRVSRNISWTSTGARPGFVPDSDAAADPRVAYKGTDAAFANNCLLARRLVEAGVRFVQLYDWAGDHHGVSPGEEIPNTLADQGPASRSSPQRPGPRPQAARLLTRPSSSGAASSGRTPMAQNSPSQPFVGRDHHPYAFTVLLAGGGIKGGQPSAAPMISATT